MIKDAMGNELTPGSMINMVPPEGEMWIGTVKEVDDGQNLIIGNKNKRIPFVRLVFDITIQIHNPQLALRNVVRVVDPRSEQIVKKALENQEGPPVQ